MRKYVNQYASYNLLYNFREKKKQPTKGLFKLLSSCSNYIIYTRCPNNIAIGSNG